MIKDKVIKTQAREKTSQLFTLGGKNVQERKNIFDILHKLAAYSIYTVMVMETLDIDLTELQHHYIGQAEHYVCVCVYVWPIES